MARDELNRGLEDVIVAETRLSRVDEAGELIVGRSALEELAPNATFEETVYPSDTTGSPMPRSSSRSARRSPRSIPDGSETGREWTPIDRR